MYSKSIETTLGLLDDCRRLYKELKYIQFQFIIDITSQLCYFCSRVNILENRNLTYRNSQTLRTISSMVKQIFRLLHFHVRMYIYIYTRNKQVSRRKDGIRGRSFVFSLEYIESQDGIFFFKASQESKHLLVGCCTELVPVDVRVLLPHFTRVRAHTTNRAQHLAPCFLIKVASPVERQYPLSFSLFDLSTALVLSPRWSTL